MKISRLKMVLIAAGLIAFGTSCKKKGCTDPEATNFSAEAKKDDGSCVYDPDTWYTEVTYGGSTYRQIEGTITSDQTLDAANDWLLSGGVFVADGVTLTIEAGTNVYAADDGTVPFLSIMQGGKVMAVGTASDPIIFKPVKANPAPGDWGGIIVNGYAPINTGLTAEGEGGTGTYGGSDASDNSGQLSYVRVEYAGKILGTDNELNGFSFNGVGSGTQLDHLQAHLGSDDGFEFFGGTASLKYAVSTGNQDDSFDWTHGWQGNGQFWVVEQSSMGGDRGIEGDNNGDNNSATPMTNPTISNITLIGVDDGDGANQGMKLREGMMANIYNAIVTGFPKRGVQVEHNVTITNLENGDLTMNYSIVDNTNPFVYTSSIGTDTSSFLTNTFDNASFNNQSATDGSLVGFLSGYVGTSTSAFDPTSLGTWFEAGTFVGAVESSNDWTAGWTVGL